MLCPVLKWLERANWSFVLCYSHFGEVCLGSGRKVSRPEMLRASAGHFQHPVWQCWSQIRGAHHRNGHRKFTLITEGLCEHCYFSFNLFPPSLPFLLFSLPFSFFLLFPPFFSLFSPSPAPSILFPFLILCFLSRKENTKAGLFLF